MLKKNEEVLSLVLIGTIVAIHISIISYYTSYMPISDDYGAVLGFINTYVQENNFLEKMKMLFWQHNEHRIVFNRLIEVLQYTLMGEISFPILVLIGSIGWFGTVYLLYRWSREQGFFKIVYFLPLIFILFAFSHAALMTWAMASLQQYWQLLFALLSIYFLQKNKLLFAYIFLLFSLFTGGGGIVLIPLIFLYFIINKKYKQMFIFLLVSIVLLFIYFILFKFVFSHKIHGPLWLLVHQPENVIQFTFTFLGNFAYVNPVAMFTGIGLVLLFLLRIKYFFHKVPFLAWSITYIILTALLVGMSRSRYGVDLALPSRYSIYSVLFLSMLYLSYMNIARYRTWVWKIGLGIGIGLYLFYFNERIPAFEARQHNAETKLDLPARERAEVILRKSAQLNTFKAFKRMTLPSVLSHLPEKKGFTDYNLTIAGEHLTSHVDKKIKPILRYEKIGNIFIDGFIKDGSNKNSAYAVNINLDDNNHVVFLEKTTTLPNGLERYSYLYSKLNIVLSTSKLNIGKHTLKMKTINHDCTGYYNDVTIPVIIKPLKEVKKLPIEEGKTKGNIEYIHIAGQFMVVKGWCVVDSSVTTSVIVDIDGILYPALYGGNRPDVAEALHNPLYRKSGFKFELNTTTLVKGWHILKIYLLSQNNTILYATSLNKKFKID